SGPRRPRAQVSVRAAKLGLASSFPSTRRMLHPLKSVAPWGAAWCIERPKPVIWMTLDAADDDPGAVVDAPGDSRRAARSGPRGSRAGEPRRSGWAGRDG